MLRKKSNRLLPVTIPYGVPSAFTTGAMPPVRVRIVQASSKDFSGLTTSSRRITDSKRDDASVRSKGGSRFNNFKTKAV